MAENKLKEIRKKEIIDSAILEFVEKGYEKTTIDSIAKRANLSKGGIYHHFNSKDEILLNTNEIFLENIKDIISRLSAILDPVECLLSFIREYLNYWKTNNKQVAIKFMAASKFLTSGVQINYQNEYSNIIVQFIEKLLIKGIMKGKLKKHNPRSRAITLFSAIDGIVPFLSIDKRLNLEDALNYFESVLIKEILFENIKEV